MQEFTEPLLGISLGELYTDLCDVHYKSPNGRKIRIRMIASQTISHGQSDRCSVSIGFSCHHPTESRQCPGSTRSRQRHRKEHTGQAPSSLETLRLNVSSGDPPKSQLKTLLIWQPTCHRSYPIPLSKKLIAVLQPPRANLQHLPGLDRKKSRLGTTTRAIQNAQSVTIPRRLAVLQCITHPLAWPTYL